MFLQKIPHDSTRYQNNPVELVNVANRKRFGTILISTQSQSVPYPIDSYTKYLFHFDGANNSTTFTDSIGHSVSRINSPIISTTQSKFNNSSMYVGTLGNIISTPNSDDFEFGTGNFTIDSWVYSINNGTGNTHFCSNHVFGEYSGFIFNVHNQSIGLTFSSGGNWNINYTSGSYIPYNTWCHVAMVRNGDTWMSFVDGVLRYSNNVSGNVLSNSQSMFIGGHPNYNGFTGYIDEFRVSKGIARWTSNFTPPTAQYGATVTSYIDVPYKFNYIGK